MVTNEMALDENFAFQIRKRRKELGLTQADVAGRLGISRERIAQVESGTASPSLRLVDRFARALDCSSLTLLVEPELTPEKK